MQTSLVIQAGGYSQRMGQNKALMSFLGQSLIQRVIARVGAIGDEILVTTNQPEPFAFLQVTCLPDLYPNQGALSGLLTALHAARYPLVAVVACDLPFANLDLLKAERERCLTTQVDGVVPHPAEGFEPFHAVYRREICLAAVQKALEAGQKRLISWFGDANLAYLLPDEIRKIDPLGLAFTNLNTPEEFMAAEKLARELQSAAGAA